MPGLRRAPALADNKQQASASARPATQEQHNRANAEAGKNGNKLSSIAAKPSHQQS